MRRNPDPARGFAAWIDRRHLEHDDPAADNGASLGVLWKLWLAEHAADTAHLDYASEEAA